MPTVTALSASAVTTVAPVADPISTTTVAWSSRAPSDVPLSAPSSMPNKAPSSASPSAVPSSIPSIVPSVVPSVAPTSLNHLKYYQLWQEPCQVLYNQ